MKHLKFPHMKFRGHIKEILATPETIMVTIKSRPGIFLQFFLDGTPPSDLTIGDKVCVTGSFLKMAFSCPPNGKHRTVFLIKSDSFTKI